MKEVKGLESLDSILEGGVWTPEPNHEISIYEGHYKLVIDSHEISVTGCIFYKWLPNKGAFFKGDTECIDIIYTAILENKQIELKIREALIGQVFLTKFSPSEEIKIAGAFSKNAVIGDKAILVEKILFTVPNLRDLHGHPIKLRPSTISSNRLKFSDGKFDIIFDKCADYKERSESIRDKGGFHIQYIGELTKVKNPISYSETMTVLHMFNTFISFLNGRRVSAVFINGIYQDEIIWSDYSNAKVDMFSTNKSWIDPDNVRNLEKIWPIFSSLWKEHKDFLNTAIHWYLAANNNSGGLEGSIIMAQTALELIYNWYVIERRKLIIGNDSANISAANKIRLLISQLGITTDVPSDFVNLKNFIDLNPTIYDAPEAIVQIRNAIVHSQEEKRNKLNTIDTTTRYESLELYIWYIELSLLKIFEYEGNYVNRTSKNNRLDVTPW